MHGALQADMQRIFDDRLDRRETGAIGDENDRLVRAFAQPEFAEWALETQDIALFHFVEHILRESSALDLADMQLEEFAVVRRVGQREIARLLVFRQERDVLPGREAQSFA